jgi:hypothetical protein
MKTLLTALCLVALVAGSTLATAAPQDSKRSTVSEFYPDVAKGDINGN